MSTDKRPERCDVVLVLSAHDGFSAHYFSIIFMMDGRAGRRAQIHHIHVCGHTCVCVLSHKYSLVVCMPHYYRDFDTRVIDVCVTNINMKWLRWLIDSVLDFIACIFRIRSTSTISETAKICIHISIERELNSGGCARKEKSISFFNIFCSVIPKHVNIPIA